MNTELVELSGMSELVSGKYDNLLSIDPRQLSDQDAAMWGLKIFSILAGPDVTWEQALSPSMELSGDPRLAGWWTDLKKGISKITGFTPQTSVQGNINQVMQAFKSTGISGALRSLFGKKTPTPVETAAVNDFGKNVKASFSKIPTAVWLAGGSIALLVIGLTVIKYLRS